MKREEDFDKIILLAFLKRNKYDSYLLLVSFMIEMEEPLGTEKDSFG